MSNVIEEQESRVNSYGPVSFHEKLRLGFNGAFAGYGDEFIGTVLAAIDPELNMKEAIAQQKKLLKIAQSKPGSMKWELLGAVAPGVLAMPFTGGASGAAAWLRATPFLGKLGLWGMVGTISSMGEKEGTISERLGTMADDPVWNIAIPFAAGASGGTLGPKAITATAEGLSYLPKRFVIEPLSRVLMKRPSKATEQHMLKLIDDVVSEGDDAISRRNQVLESLSRGESIPDMSEAAAKEVAGLYTHMTGAGEQLRNYINTRAQKIPAETMAAINDDLTNASGSNIPYGQNLTAAFTKTTDEIEGAASEAYKEIWANEGARTYGGDLFDTIEGLIHKRAYSENRGLINKAMQREGLEPIVKAETKTVRGKTVKTGNFVLARQPTLFEGEVIKRVFMDAAKPLTGRHRSILKKQEKKVVEALNELSPELQAVRQKWATIASAKDYFEEGSRKLLSRSSEDAGLTIAEAAKTPTDLIALRIGAAVALKKKAEGSGGVTRLLRKLRERDVVQEKERTILEDLYPGDSWDKLVQKIDLSNKVLDTQKTILQGSPTASRLAAASRHSSIGGVTEDITGSLRLNLPSMVRLAGRLLQGKGQKFTRSQQKEMVQILTNEDPAVLKKLMADQRYLEDYSISVATRTGLKPEDVLDRLSKGEYIPDTDPAVLKRLIDAKDSFDRVFEGLQDAAMLPSAIMMSVMGPQFTQETVEKITSIFE
jgi:hypothetical protein